MSGGSYDYLFSHYGLAELANQKEQLEKMANRLAGLGYAKDAASETLEVLLRLRQAELYVDVVMDRLGDVWKAVEWWDSCDSSESSVIKALENYRRDK